METKKLLTVVFVLLLFSLGLFAGCGRSEQAALVSGIKGEQEITSAESQEASSNSRIDPGKADASEKYYLAGLDYYEQGHYQQAISCFDQAIGANPNNYKIYTAKGIALCFSGDYQQGTALIEKTLNMQPDYAPAFYDLAMAYKLQRRYDEALYWFGRTIEADSGNTWSYYGMATIYADRGEKNLALDYLGKAIYLDAGVKAVARRQAHFARMQSLPEFQALVK